MIDPIRTRLHAGILEQGLHRYKGNFVTDLDIDSQASDVVFTPKPMQCAR